MSASVDVVDRIDDLLADRKCPHCDRDWHRAPITRAIDRMFTNGAIDADFLTRKDTSPILCDGSKFIGPLRPEPTQAWPDYGSTGWLTGTLIESVLSFSWETLSSVVFPQYIVSKFDAPWVTFWDKAYNPIATNKPCEPPPKLDVEFGSDNWLPPLQPVNVPTETHMSVMQRWHEFTAPNVPAPESRPADWTGMAEKINQQFTNTYPKGKNHEGI